MQNIKFFLSKTVFFQNFDWSNLIFNQSKSSFKNFVSLCLVRLIKPIFRSIEHRVSAFFKKSLWLIQTFFKSSFQTFLLSPTWQGSTTNFLSFSFSIFARFSSLKVDKTILSLFLVLFSCFHAYFHAFKGHFRTSIDLGFLLIHG